jgi:hypothetical protein
MKAYNRQQASEGAAVVAQPPNQAESGTVQGEPAVNPEEQA